MSLSTIPIVKNCHILAVIYFIFLKERARPKLKVLQYQIWASGKRSKEQLSCKASFNTFWQISYSNVRLKLC